MAAVSQVDSTSSNGIFFQGGTFFLEGCAVRNFKPAQDADMSSGNVGVTFNLSLQIDRYYPATPLDLWVPTADATQVAAAVQAQIIAGQ